MMLQRRKSCKCLKLMLQTSLIISHISLSLYALSISPATSSKSVNTNNKNINVLTPTTSRHQARQEKSATADLNQQHTEFNHQHRPRSSFNGQNKHYSMQHESTTAGPPLMMTTVNQYNFVDPAMSTDKQQKNLQQQSKLQSSRRSFNYNNNHNEVGSSGDDAMHAAEELGSTSDTDSNPLQTVNNHSGGSGSSKASQYVDVSNLVGVSHHNVNNQNHNNHNLTTTKSRVGLPECATQQVCNAIFVRMNYTQRLCECSGNYNWKCSNNLDPQDGHTIELTRKYDKRIYTQIKTCEPLREVRACKSPSDWTLLALQSERSGKAHYVVVCKCPTWAQLEGPYTHNHPPYANIPGIRVYGMLCVHQTARSSAQTYSSYNPSLSIYPEFPWTEALSVANTSSLLTTLDSTH